MVIELYSPTDPPESSVVRVFDRGFWTGAPWPYRASRSVNFFPPIISALKLTTVVVEATCKGAVPMETFETIGLAAKIWPLKVSVPATVWSVERSMKFFVLESVPP